MKQFIASVFPDKAFAWKLTAVVLLVLLVLTILANVIVPFASALFSKGDAGSENPQPDSLMEHFAQNQQMTQDLQQEIDSANTTITELNTQIQELQTTIESMSAQGTADAETIAKLNEQIGLYMKQIDQITLERDEAVSELNALREQLSKDHTIVVKIVRTGLFSEEPVRVNLHVSAEEYAMYKIGDVIQPTGELDFPTGDNWTAVVTDMYVDLQSA